MGNGLKVRRLIIAVGILCVSLLLGPGTVSGAAAAAEDLADERVTCASKNVFHCDDHDGECVPAGHKCDGLPQCSTGRDESVQVCGCLPSEFQCNSTHCIDIVKRCDLQEDCVNGLDEERCETFECHVTQFKCANHKCVSRDRRCDFVDDCGDGSDEEECGHRQCDFSSFRCDNGECTLTSRLCDGVKNCKDGSDELPERCDAEFQCPTGFYISAKYKCDGWDDCPITKHDEDECGECRSDQFRCPSGRCVNEENVCDQNCDCPGCQDELECGQEALYCPKESHYRCRNNQRCLPQRLLCDNNNDCKDNSLGSDEIFCHNTSSDCSASRAGKNGGETTRCPQGGQCLPVRARCDHYNDCIDGTDEDGCESKHPPCSGDEFRCRNHICVTLTSRCDSVNDCMDWSDEIGCDDHSCPENYQKCATGQCIPKYKWCNHWPNCPDGSDEKNCDYRECGEEEFGCDNGECIPKYLECYNGRQVYREGCQDRSHLIHCKNYTCGQDKFKCHNSFCIDKEQVCDQEPDCFINASDQQLCPYACPYKSKVCECQDTKMTCDNKGLEEVPLMSENEHISVLHWSGNNLSVSLSSESFNGSQFYRVTTLDLSRNGLTTLPVGVFESLWRLTYLNLANNSITRLSNGSLAGLHNVRQLFLEGNGIQTVEPGVFLEMGELTTLDLSHQNITSLDVNTFRGLRSLRLLNLSSNQMTYLHNGVFNGLNHLLELDISDNSLVLIHTNVFYSLPSLHRLLTDEFRFCCQAKNVPECKPEGDAFSSCADLMSNTVLRLCIWILGLTSFVGNGMVIVWRARNPRASKVHSFLITNLAVGDLVMGLYLVIIAAVDAHYRGEYSLHDNTWRHSPLCHMAGFFAMFSSELSVLTLTIITLDRLSCIIFPLKIRRLGVKGAVGVMAFVWLVVFVLAFMPLSGIESFGNFYGRSAVCLALPLTPDRPQGWEYSVAIVLVMNLVSLFIIAISYIWMFLVARKTRTAVRCRDSKGDTAMARRMTMIVMTDLVCWIPIILLGLASMGGVHTSNQVYAWIAVFILPINSAINPILYTISTAPFLGNVTNRARCFRKSFINSFNADTKHSFVDDRTVHTYTTDRRSSPRRGETILYSAKRDRKTSPKNGETIWLKNLRVNGPEYSRGSSSDV